MLVIPVFSISQNIKGGLITGFNLTQIDGDQLYGYHKIGLNLGATAIVPVGKKFSATIETIYTQKGSYQSPKDTLTSPPYKLILNYVEAPVFFSYTDKDVVKIGAGFSYGRLVGFQEWEHLKRVPWTTPDGPYSPNDYDVLVDLQFKIHNGLWFDTRFFYSMVKIRTRIFTDINGNTWIRKQYNNDLAFRLIYVFKEKPSPKKKDRNVNKIK
jgi:hypothetical protein